MMNRSHLTVLCLLLVIAACNNPEKKPPLIEKAIERKEARKAKDTVEKSPIINVVDTVQPKRIVVFIKDSAANLERLNLKLAQIYGARLPECFKKNKISIAGAPIAWYTSLKAPFFFEAGIPVNKRPAKLTPGIKVKETAADSVLLAHFFGPYDLKHVGYETLKDILKEHKKKQISPAYEVYITNPVDVKGKQMDPYKVQTDIIIPRR